MKRKNNIVLIGMMGCGKTTIAHILGEELNKPVVDIDDYLVNKYDMTIPEMFEISEDYFRKREHECCRLISKWDNFVISTGGGVIKNSQNIECLQKNGIVIYLDRPVEQILQDIDASSRPLLKDGVLALYELYNQRHEQYLKACDYRVENTSTVNDVVKKIINILEEHEKSYCENE